ncbi:hypothetical protein [Bdellovibrio sp. KM01]|uniref:hypothetical protein n=1 Tax=Bdellovibrio sp. KM01 TaxID=2748865 RepID=UPI0015EA4538|nr:hypothetical protein [Bdellovibrio sp. KM01]QLY25394.1 hypothetical protein HW988_18610 [Bdellovibrio sp. KM01]
MRTLIVFLVFVLNSMALAASTTCVNAEKTLREMNAEIFGEKSLHIDMTDKVKQAMELVKNCKVSLRKIGVPDTIYADALENNRRDEIIRRKFILALYATSGRIDSQLQSFKKYMLGTKDINPEKTEKFLTEMKSKADQSFAAESKSCTAIDLRSKTGPVRNQGTDGWCYAFTVANMVSWKSGKEISAAGVAFGYTDNGYHDLYRMIGMTQDQITNQGFTTAAFRASKHGGFCLESELPSEGFNGINTNVPLAFLDKLGKKAVGGKISEDEFIKVAKTMFPNLSKEQFSEIIRKSSKSTYFNTLVRKSCEHRVSADGMEMSFFTNFDSEKFGKQIEKHLEQGTPVEVGYNADFFAHPYSPSGNAYHSSLLVGRRMNPKTGQCEYLLKNTYGTTWKPESAEFDSADGYAWVPKSRMIEATRNASYVK